MFIFINKEGSNKIINFTNPPPPFPRVGVLVLRCGHMSHIVKMHYFSTPRYTVDKTNQV